MVSDVIWMFLSPRDVAGEREHQYWLTQPMRAVRFAGLGFGLPIRPLQYVLSPWR
jgi:hypothetical protein